MNLTGRIKDIQEEKERYKAARLENPGHLNYHHNSITLTGIGFLRDEYSLQESWVRDYERKYRSFCAIMSMVDKKIWKHIGIEDLDDRMQEANEFRFGQYKGSIDDYDSSIEFLVDLARWDVITWEEFRDKCTERESVVEARFAKARDFLYFIGLKLYDDVIGMLSELRTSSTPQ